MRRRGREGRGDAGGAGGRDDARVRLSRRDFVKGAGAFTLGAGAFPTILIGCGGGSTSGGGASPKGGNKQLKILQWSHFVPAYDKWFDPWAEKWGNQNGVKVSVDHINYADITPRTAAEINAGQGHDLILWNTPPSAYEPSVHDLTDLVKQVEKKYGPQLPFARATSHNPKTNHYFGFTYSYAPDPGDYRKSLWQQAGMGKGPTTWEDVLTATTQIKNATGKRSGIGMSQEPDSNMAARALIWTFGGSVQDQNENVTVNSPQVVQAVEYMVKLFKQAETAEVFSWTAASNNQGLVAGQLSFILNSISAYRTAQQTNPDIADDIFFTPALKGPGGIQIASEHVIQTYIIPKFSKQVDTAKEFLTYLADHASDFVYQSQLYEFPTFPKTNAQDKLFGKGGWLDKDPYKSNPADKLSLLKNAQQWSTNVGHPGPANPAIGEVFDTNVLPNMMAAAAKGQRSPQEAVADAEKQIKQIFSKWRQKGLIGGNS